MTSLYILALSFRRETQIPFTCSLKGEEGTFSDAHSMKQKNSNTSNERQNRKQLSFASGWSIPKAPQLSASIRLLIQGNSSNIVKEKGSHYTCIWLFSIFGVLNLKIFTHLALVMGRTVHLYVDSSSFLIRKLWHPNPKSQMLESAYKWLCHTSQIDVTEQ